MYQCRCLSCRNLFIGYKRRAICKLCSDTEKRLIAAAPDLLEALKLADLMLSGANMNHRVVETKVRAAIAKATGGAV